MGILVRSIPLIYCGLVQYFLRVWFFSDGAVYMMTGNELFLYHWVLPCIFAVGITLITGMVLNFLGWVLTGYSLLF